MLLKKSDLAENDRTFLNANLGNTEAAGADVDGGGYGVLGPEEGAVVHGGYGRGVALQQREVPAQSLHHKNSEKISLYTNEKHTDVGTNPLKRIQFCRLRPGFRSRPVLGRLRLREFLSGAGSGSW